MKTIHFWKVYSMSNQIKDVARVQYTSHLEFAKWPP